jgi:nitrogen regulatory protein P-II 1
MLKKIECFIQPFKLEEVKNALIDAGVEGITLSDVSGFGKQRGYIAGEIPNKEVKFLPKVKLEIVVDEEILDNVTNTIVRLAQTGEFGSGKIFILPVEDAIRIRTQESGINAIV